MRKTLVVFVLSAACSNAVEPEVEAWRLIPLPPECIVETMAACYTPPGEPPDDTDCRTCPQPDGTIWFFLNAEWGSEHFEADFTTRLCRIYGNGAWATR